ncbi:MAG: SRPBCC domain-containing protein [Planctomycetes bacterium]|nr:SRPBCC domain-containing protein [Planctomycetota bacterium]
MTKQKSKDLVIVRIFDAPRKLVWRAWTEPAHFKKWWGPKEFSCPTAKMDVRVGGKYHWAMRAADGNEHWSAGVYREVTPMDRLVYTSSFADAKGNLVPATHYGMPDTIPMEMLVRVEFENEGSKTKMTITHSGLPTDIAAGATVGWNSSLDKLAESL